MITIQDANKGIQEVIEYLKSIENVWNKTRTLKIYNVCYHASDIMDKYPLVKEEYNEDDLFSWFCDDSYNDFLEFVREECKQDTRKYIGRTSSFYLTDIEDKNIGLVLDNLINELYGYFGEIEIDEDGKASLFVSDYFTQEEILEDAQEELNLLANSFLKDTKEYMQDAIKTADYIDNFIKNQVDIFTEYIEGYNQNLLDLEEEAANEEKAFTERYRKAISELTGAFEAVLKETDCTLSDIRRITSKAMEQVNVKPIDVLNEAV